MATTTRSWDLGGRLDEEARRRLHRELGCSFSDENQPRHNGSGTAGGGGAGATTRSGFWVSVDSNGTGRLHTLAEHGTVTDEQVTASVTAAGLRLDGRRTRTPLWQRIVDAVTGP